MFTLKMSNKHWQTKSMKVFQLFGVLFWGVTHNENELFGGGRRLPSALFLVTIIIIAAIVSNNHS